MYITVIPSVILVNVIVLSHVFPDAPLFLHLTGAGGTPGVRQGRSGCSLGLAAACAIPTHEQRSSAMQAAQSGGSHGAQRTTGPTTIRNGPKRT